MFNSCGGWLTCSGLSPDGTQVYSSRAQPLSSSDCDCLWVSKWYPPIMAGWPWNWLGWKFWGSVWCVGIVIWVDCWLIACAAWLWYGKVCVFGITFFDWKFWLFMVGWFCLRGEYLEGPGRFGFCGIGRWCEGDFDDAAKSLKLVGSWKVDIGCKRPTGLKKKSRRSLLMSETGHEMCDWVGFYFQFNRNSVLKPVVSPNFSHHHTVCNILVNSYKTQERMHFKLRINLFHFHACDHLLLYCTKRK